MAKKKNKSASAKKAAAAAASRGIVGPDYVQVLSGTLASKNITLVLCGESHHDAIDVTRSGGGKIKEGWIATDLLELAAEMVGKFGGLRESEEARFRCGICKRNNKAVPLGKAREWGRDIGEREVEYIPHGHQMALLWVAADKDGKKGRSYLVELFLEELEGGGGGDGPRSHLPSDVTELLDCMTNAAKHMRGVKSLAKVVQDMKGDTTSNFSDLQPQHTLLSWDDLDSEARQLNHRRLLGEEISTSEYDELIRNRKQKRWKDENLWTWDDWLAEVHSKLKSSQSEDKPALHVVIESAIPPCEVELCRDVMPEFEGTHAADCIRCLSEDSNPSEADLYDPAADGFGSYIDYSYRRLLAVGRDESINFLHCVDCRDLGCEHACIEDSLHKEWMDLLEAEEKERLLGSGSEAAHAHHKDGRCLPDWGNSLEEKELDNLRSSGVLKQSDTDDEASDTDAGDTSELITFPSFESFFGQCTDIMYYTPNFKVAYAPFLGKCVRSFDMWNGFFDQLFFGGTVDRALSMLDLSTVNYPYLHVRSPIMKHFNVERGEYEWHERDNEEHDLTLPMLPVQAFLKAKGSNPPRTWTSNMFSLLLESEREDLQEMVEDIRKWVHDDIKKHCNDPKLSDDEIGGGEWFLAYLRQCHRDIYEDIDRSDPTALLRKQYAAGETKKHRIGYITIPMCRDGFRLISEELSCLDKVEPDNKPTMSRKAEVMAKILVDIYMSKLIDVATVVKIGTILAEETTENVTIVCYLGSVHTRAVGEFFTQPKYGFKRKIFCGKQDWEEDEGRIVHLPAELWSL